MKIGTTALTNCKIGSVQVNEVRIGSTLVWSYGFDPDAQAFITAAGITDPIQQNAINQLVLDLKGYSIWTKMKALYPFVGGTATTHKYNLKNPLDTNAAFRLVFSGGWTHSSTGALPNGTNAWANTYFNPSTNSLTYNNNHLSYYSRTNAISIYDIGSGENTGLKNLGLYLRRTGDVAGYDSGNYLTNRNTFSNIDSKGFFNGTVISSNSKYFKNGNNQSTKSLTSSTITALSVYIGAFNEDNIASYYTSKQVSFASIGLGLSDTEAANFYTAVQTFQTTLSRQV